MSSHDLDQFEEAHVAEWACLEAHLAGGCAERIGIVLLENSSDLLYVKVRPYWWMGLLDAEMGEIWQELPEDLTKRACAMGGKTFFDWLQNSCCHAIRVSPPQSLRVGQIEAALDQIYRTHVDRSEPAHALDQIARRGPGAVSSRDHCPVRLTNSGKLRSWGKVWLMQGAAAASLFLTATIVGLHSDEPLTRNHPSVIRTMEDIRLPFDSGFRYRPVQLQLDSLEEPHRRHSRPRKKHPRAPVVWQHLIQPRTFTRSNTELAVLAAPPPCCDLNAETKAPVESVLAFEPELPEFRPRHRKLIRIMAVVATPFRFLASR